MDNVIMVSMIRRGKSNNVVRDGLFEIRFLFIEIRLLLRMQRRNTLYILSKIIIIYSIHKMFLNERQTNPQIWYSKQDPIVNLCYVGAFHHIGIWLWQYSFVPNSNKAYFKRNLIWWKYYTYGINLSLI